MNRIQISLGSTPGATTLLTVFAVLCLSVFALLCLTSARGEERLGSSMQEAVMDYYAADLAAEEILARLRLGELPAGVRQNGAEYCYSCPISDTQTLDVCVTVEADGSYAIEKWQARSTAGWETEQGMETWPE